MEAKAARAVEAEKAMADMTKRVKRVSFECVLREACTRVCAVVAVSGCR